MEFWASRMLEASENDDLTVLNLAQALGYEEDDDHDPTMTTIMIMTTITMVAAINVDGDIVVLAWPDITIREICLN